MQTTIPTRIVGLVVAVVIAAAACSSADTARETTQPTPTASPTSEPTPDTTPTATPTTTTDPAPDATPTPTPTPAAEPVPDTTAAPSPATAATPVELAPVIIDEIGVTSVAPQGWTEASAGLFTNEEALLGFHAVASRAAPDPTDDGFELLERLEAGGRVWDLYALEADELAVLIPMTEVGDTTFFITLQAPVDLVDQYAESVGMPALEAFDVEVATYPALEQASVTVDGRDSAYASGGSGPTTVVFEAGFDEIGMDAWLAVANDAARFSRVFAYDRAGVGGSDLADAPRDGMHVVEDLRSILAASGHQPPYVLVGHSLGGMFMELFARTYPAEVVGLVLVDGRPAGYTERCVEALGAAACGEPSEDEINEYPEPYRSELLSMPTTEQQVLAAPPLGPLPTVVLASPQSDGQPDTDKIWIEVQREQTAALNATLVIAEESGHYIQFDQPDLVLDAIQGLVEQQPAE